MGGGGGGRGDLLTVYKDDCWMSKRWKQLCNVWKYNSDCYFNSFKQEKFMSQINNNDKFKKGQLTYSKYIGKDYQHHLRADFNTMQLHQPKNHHGNFLLCYESLGAYC